MNSYHTDQSETYALIRNVLSSLNSSEREALKKQIHDYLDLRNEIDEFLTQYFSDLCSTNCYESRVSACCTREGIVTFFGDLVVNALVSSEEEIETLLKVLEQENTGFKCVYLGDQGCLWRVKPIVCEMFLCNPAKEAVFKKNPESAGKWKAFEERKKGFTWPDRPVLFDTLEQIFMDKGFSSSLMYLHNSPGLLRVKQMAKKGK